MKVPFFYLLAIAAAEMVTIFFSPVAGVVSHTLLLLTLVAHASFASRHPGHRLYLALSLPPLIRILSLSMPLGAIPILYWYAIIAVPLLTATFVCIRLLGYSRWDVGLNFGKLPMQVMVGLLGLPLGVVEYLILKPKPLADSLSFGSLWLPMLILMVGTGFTEELIFRGVLQKTVVERLRGGAILYVSVLFAVLHVGYYSLVELAFVFVVGLFFSWVVAKSGSILGVTLAHGLLNVTLFLFTPLLGVSVKSLESIRVPDVNFLSLAPAFVREASGLGEKHAEPISTLTATGTEPWPTPTPLITPTSIPTATSLPFKTPTSILSPTPVLGLVRVSGTEGTGVRFRDAPGLTAGTIRVLPEGTLLQTMGEQEQRDGEIWWKVMDAGGGVGWVAATYLRAVSVTPTALATARP